MRFKIFGTILVIVLAVGLGFSVFTRVHAPPSETAFINRVKENAQNAVASSSQKFQPPNTQQKTGNSTSTKDQPPHISEVSGTNAPPPPSEETLIHISLIAGGAHYTAAVAPNTTIYEAMIAIASSSSFTFTTKSYSGLGYMIETINNLGNAGGKYWALYVNGTYATLGISQYKLSDGNSIEWKYQY